MKLHRLDTTNCTQHNSIPITLEHQIWLEERGMQYTTVCNRKGVDYCPVRKVYMYNAYCNYTPITQQEMKTIKQELLWTHKDG